ncbi:flagellar hook assembly protein FlgD [Aromatoleum bremense]|uniref:Basal-body rod modification protein FlgD n=1 Tax=Aromatoleum bremense TaxID=76115 RepID=A0ABX1P1W0_9RHOO|nr:flagellar hook assembly protein FlgD [Aromatoleum bremense]NMG17612.1 flagellar hook assembly protein FlgD [Aromatoleum bremense]QTQ30888.1 Flagellar hook capping protein [Aromatoleum bremense]
MTTVNSATSSAADAVMSNLARNSAAPEKSEELSQTRFLKLLTTQLKNQDPMNPLDNAQVTSQLAQISTVDGIERLNTMLGQIMEGQQSSEAMQAASLVGRGVLVPGKGLLLTEAGAVGGFSLDAPADKVTMSIKDANGLEVANVDLGAFDAGTHNFQWDGAAADGTRAANGKYTVSLAATAGDTTAAAESLEFGAVSSVVRGPKSTDLQIGDLGIFKMSEIRQIL